MYAVRSLCVWVVAACSFHGTVLRLSAQPINAKQVFEQCAGAVVRIRTETSGGSGFFIGPQYIVTNKHVIRRPGISQTEYYRYPAAYYTHRQIQVTTRSGATIPVIEVNAFRDHPDIDLAVLKVPRHQGVALPILNKTVDVGEPVVAIGHPRGMEWTLTQGSISKSDLKYHAQLDVATDPGSSGGPVINKFGQVVAVVEGGYPYSATGKFGIRSDVLAGLLNYYGIPYTTEPIVLPSPEELQSQIRLIEQRERSLERLRAQLERERSSLDSTRTALNNWQQRLVERERQYASMHAELDAKIKAAQEYLNDYESKRDKLLSFQEALDQREKALDRRAQELDSRERQILKHELLINEKLGDHFSVDFLASPMYQLSSQLLIPLRASVGIYYRFGFERDQEGVVARADKIGVVATRQLTLLGWEQDELSFAIEFNSVVRFSMGAVIRQRTQAGQSAVIPHGPLYTAAVLVDFLPERPLHVGMSIATMTDQRFRSPVAMVGIQLGFEINFFRW
ncbi:MAG: hypothetical protein KatS3mg040_0050 [Candidatus Kapaibacterium sp.]|nr:MAG: hypothetical protein KatS3mg040_0050 [Candidatus Kapabacteria bacterium]